MEIKTKLTNYTLNDDDSNYLNERLAAIEKFADTETDAALCEVELGREVGNQQHGNVWRVEIQIIRSGERFYAKATEASINAAIDMAKDELIAQLKKSKGKNFSRSRKVGAKIKEWLRFGQR